MSLKVDPYSTSIYEYVLAQAIKKDDINPLTDVFNKNLTISSDLLLNYYTCDKSLFKILLEDKKIDFLTSHILQPSSEVVQTASETVTAPEMSQKYRALFDKVCKEMQAIDPKAIDDCSLEKTAYTQREIGEEIQAKNRRDPLTDLIRLDPFMTEHLLRADDGFRKLAYQTVMFNTSRDAAMRLKAGVVSTELRAIFEEFKGLYKKYLREPARELDDLYVYDVQRLYMKLLSFNSQNIEPHSSVLYQMCACRSFNDCLSFMRSNERNVSGYQDVSRDKTKAIFFLTYAPISMKTMMRAWAAGIFIMGCTSKKTEKAHGIDFSSSAFFQHDEAHYSLHAGSASRQSSAGRQSCRENAKKIFDHIDELESSGEKELAKGIEFAIFMLHHEKVASFSQNTVCFASLPTKEDLNFSVEKKRIPENWKFAFFYYQRFAEANFSKLY